MTHTQLFTIKENQALTHDIYRLQLTGDTSSITAPGQFVNIALQGFYLRRPISVCRWTPDNLTLIYKVVGEGTDALAAMDSGELVDLLLPLGNGFTLPQRNAPTLLIGGGVGTPPLLGLAEALCKEGITPTVLLGFRSSRDVFLLGEFLDLGCQVVVATEDGTLGTGGYVTNLAEFAGGWDSYYTCGPEPMLRAVHAAMEKRGIPGQLSFEERMACGFGACMGCSCETLYGSKRICKDGPVLESREVKWGGAEG